MQTDHSYRLHISALLLSAVLTACGGGGGGGGGGSGSSPPPTSTGQSDDESVNDPILDPLTSSNTSYTAGQSYYDTSGNQWIEYIPGDIPVVISVPHDGTLQPNVQAGCNVLNGRDINTAPLAREISNAFFTRYGKRPHLIINNLHRSKVDMNRNKPSSYTDCGVRITPEMDQAWTDWRQFITDALNTSSTEYGNALYIDLHGHDHTIRRFEVGYYYTASELRSFVSSLGYSNNRYWTLKNLPRFKNNQVTVRELLYGNSAFGTQLDNRSIDAVPSQLDQAPNVGEDYYNGGVNTITFTSSKFPKVFGWQIETHSPGVRDNATNRTASGIAMADSIVAFLNTHHPVFQNTKRWDVPSPIP